MACEHTWQLRGIVVNGVENISIVCMACGEIGTSVDVNQELEQTATECLDLLRRVKELEDEEREYCAACKGEDAKQLAEMCAFVAARDKRIKELWTRYSRLLVVACKALGVIEACAPNASVRGELDRVTGEGCDFLATWREL